MKKYAALLLVLVLTLSLFAGCSSDNDDPSSGSSGEFAAKVPEGVTATEDNARVFYEIFVGSFSDSNGDGIGDLRGIINRMDYLNDGDDSSGKSLGVEGLWLTPIFASGSYHKYDIDDYYTIDKAFGTQEDLKELAELCHQRNVKLIIDLPVNHTSKNCEWFKSFTQAHKDGAVSDKYYDFYSYYTEGQDAPAGRAFAKLYGTDVYYECNFYDGMPELNFDSEEVRQTMLDVAKHYLDLGVDGFRFDAAKYVYFGDNNASEAFWSWYLSELRAVKPDLYTVAEVWDADVVTSIYYPSTNCFNFTVSQAEGHIAKSVQGDASRYISYVGTYLDSIKDTNPDAMFVPFIANHDTDRAAGYLPSSNGRAQMAANLLLLSPGSPFLYYGEEIGMRGSRGSANTDANRRLAMLWGDDDTVRDPTGTTYSSDKRAEGSVVEELSNENSLYNYYKRVILVRKANPEIARGEFKPLSLSGVNVSGFTSSWKGNTVCVLHNASTDEAVLDLSKLGLDFSVLRNFVGMGEANLDGTTLTIGGQTSVVLGK